VRAKNKTGHFVSVGAGTWIDAAVAAPPHDGSSYLLIARVDDPGEKRWPRVGSSGQLSKSVRQMPRLGPCELKCGCAAPPEEMAERATRRVADRELASRFNDAPRLGKFSS
jgi:hypothetical protein